MCAPARALKKSQENRDDSRNQLLTKLAFAKIKAIMKGVTLLLVNLLPLTGGYMEFRVIVTSGMKHHIVGGRRFILGCPRIVV